MRVAILAGLAVALAAGPAPAHDPSAWGGTFRSRDGGATWTPIDAGLFIGGAVALAIDPTNPNHILYATDTRLLRSSNGGRDWSQEPASVFLGPTMALAFDPSDKIVLAATAAGVFRSEAGGPWKSVDLPTSALPSRAIVAGALAGRLYLTGARGLYRSDDHGQTWVRQGEPDARLTAIAVVQQPAELLVGVIEGRVFTSVDAGESWQPRNVGLPDGKIETISVDPAAARLWAAGADRVYLSDDAAQTWRAHGQPLPQPGTRVRGVAASADGTIIVLTTHRGVYRSTDAGGSWALMEGNLPVHLESGPLVRDPRDPGDPATLYAGFSLTPYDEIWRRAVEGSNLLSQVDPMSLAGGAAFLILLGVAGTYAVRRLLRSASAAAAPPTTRTPSA
ncbi:MAG TPA: YCF48-related protein [Burkholderiales bacterium]|nr:YCF48-related protein [Burkholderiales bacterium]